MIMAEITEGDRVYATETIIFSDGYDSAERIVVGTEGTVECLTGHDDIDLLVEWDSGYTTGVNSASVALVPVLAR
jgi:hypothetical protein